MASLLYKASTSYMLVLMAFVQDRTYSRFLFALLSIMKTVCFRFPTQTRE
jgi:hypothetical protein